ncbi:3-oxoacyl-ACP reductase FabG [Coxiella endosymbiont of Rhipicephalus microplus]|uniref:3-oxoacyl-ACP reductase FabG n=1 Tax=Coxiella endosymbiont of Rhipicephalus microplus TaxID=1656186 RepID=UPI000C809CE5|nr:3-oxoacyl-ACP reductase FabG [Coxiella endosymbiont of Rhipicephalus microplus]PMB54896.1 3-oxoacyl-[acyl-carrier protein] reductase [Coxiella-like endosymbiont]
MVIKGKITLITGASRGIGLAIAKEAGLQGAIVLGTATSEENAHKITQILAEKGLQGKGYVLNVCDPDAIKTILAKIQEDFASVDILINNAGITRDNIFLRMKPKEWESVIETNLNGVFHLTKACLKTMLKKRWGRIINITSVIAIMGNPGQANYVAAKAGLIGLTKVIALEYAAYGITANCIAPGFIKTEMTDALSKNQQEAILIRVPIKRMGRPEEIAKAAIYLASEEAGYITGETLHINGGMCMV